MNATSHTESPVFSPQLACSDPLLHYWLAQVTYRLRREICWRRFEQGAVTGSEAAGLSAFEDGAALSLDLARYSEDKQRFFRDDVTAAWLCEQLERPAPSNESPGRGSLAWVIEQLDLDDTETFVLALGLAPAFDAAMGNVIAACRNEPSRTLPCLSLAQQLWREPDEIPRLADPAHPLFRHGLLLLGESAAPASASIDWLAPLMTPTLVAASLCRPDAPPPRCLQLLPEQSGAEARSEPVRLEQAPFIQPLLGPSGCDPLAMLCDKGRPGPFRLARFSSGAGLLDQAAYFNAVLTCCWLHGLDLFLERPPAPLKSQPGQAPLVAVPITLYLALEDKTALDALPAACCAPPMRLPGLSFEERLSFWRQALGAHGDELQPAMAECARRFRYQKKTLQNIVARLGRGGPIAAADLFAACRAESEPDVGASAQLVKPRFNIEELILPARQRRQLEELLRAMTALTEVHYGWGTGSAWNEAGISAMFAGPPGTGKTMAAEALAHSLDLPMYRIDLSQVVNKYIGETEKNLKRLFDAAESSDIILFFDEADALFGNRTEVKDSRDRYANLEVSYLLERMERFKGLAILATNRRGDLDAAFLRRLRFIINFPFPEAAERRLIWERVLPEKVDCNSLDLDFLAKSFPLAGGHIRSVVFAACLQSAAAAAPTAPRRLEMAQLIVAVKRELDKIKRGTSLERFGAYAKIVAELEA